MSTTLTATLGDIFHFACDIAPRAELFALSHLMLAIADVMIAHVRLTFTCAYASTLIRRSKKVLAEP